VATGLVTALAIGTCTISANQSGNIDFAPAPQATQSLPVNSSRLQSITFGAPPALTIFGIETVSAVSSAHLAVNYTSTTPALCSVGSMTGLVTSLAAGNCIIAANQAGNANYDPAPEETLSLAVAPWAGAVTVPVAPIGVTATTANSPTTVLVNAGSTSSGGSAIIDYQVISSPGNFTATGSTFPITVTCGATCSGESFRVTARNSAGSSVASLAADVITRYNVVEIFYEPDTQPRDSIFTGSFTYNATSGEVSNLSGYLTESMTGNPYSSIHGYGMTELFLNHQLSAVSDGQGGLLVTTFLLNITDTLSSNPIWGETDGWAPGSGMGLYFGSPGANIGNAYARIYVNLANPTMNLSATEIDKLAYADCAPGGMMGATCMTGTTLSGYGSIGTMSGYPKSQIITKQ
jgi:hypothetical protein